MNSATVRCNYDHGSAAARHLKTGKILKSEKIERLNLKGRLWTAVTAFAGPVVLFQLKHVAGFPQGKFQ